MVQRRAGKTIKVSISLAKDDLDTLKRLARDSFEGNLSAAIAEAARRLRQREARRRLVDQLGGPSLTKESAAAIDAEQEGRGRRRKPAA